MKKIVLVIGLSFLLLNSLSYATKSIPLTWKIMTTLNTTTGEMSDSLKTLQGKTISITGFIVPTEMDESLEQVKEFFLVPDPLSCYHIPPPPLNQMVYVFMKDSIPFDINLRAYTLKGTLSIKTQDFEPKYIGFELQGEHAKAEKIEDIVIDHDYINNL